MAEERSERFEGVLGAVVGVALLSRLLGDDEADWLCAVFNTLENMARGLTVASISCFKDQRYSGDKGTCDGNDVLERDVYVL